MKIILRSAGLAVVLLAVSLGAKTAQGATCEGTCILSCDSGATSTYYEPNYSCCTHEQPCPDGSAAHPVEWWPGTCGNHEFC
jgi:hypothetical protein